MIPHVDLLTISDLKRTATGGGRIEARIHAQVESVVKKETRDQKPYFELSLTDAQSDLTLRAWNDSPNFKVCEGLRAGGFLEISGEFTHNGAYGLDSKRWICRELTTAEAETLLAGPEPLRARQQADFEFIGQTVDAIGDPRLRALGNAFLAEFGDRFRRTAAARNYHHARRGGLVEHVAQMMRCALAVAGVYPGLNRDLLVAGVLFHDAGKLWENAVLETGFVMPYAERGELMGHITIGIEVVNNLWRKLLATDEAKTWPDLQPASEDVRMHLLHTIAAHHGEMQFGSPIVPKTPESQALHYIDNLDAKLEMFARGYQTAAPLAARIFERVWPLPGNLVVPLAKFEPPPAAEPGASG
jgi:3'-5' exoribonuclease